MKTKKILIIFFAVFAMACNSNEVRNEASTLSEDMIVSVNNNPDKTKYSLIQQHRDNINEEALMILDETDFDRIDLLEYNSNEDIQTKIDDKETYKQLPIETFSQIETLKYSNIGFYAVDLTNNKVVAKHNENNALVPASIMKILTSVAAIEILGKNSTLETKVLYDGNITNAGILNGNIYIQGSGDPTLGSKEFNIPNKKDKFINNWVRQIKAKGIKSINGDIIVLDDIFGYDGFHGKWLWEDMGTSYGQSIYGVNVFDNLFTAQFTTPNIGQKPKLVKTVPNMKGISFSNQAVVVGSGKRTINIKGLPLNNERIISGNIVKSNKIQYINGEIPDPGTFLSKYLYDKLQNENITISGEAKTSRTTSQKPINPKIITVTTSPKISEIVKSLLKDSNNLYTQSLFQIITKVKGIDMKQLLNNHGHNTNSLILDDGSGLSRGNSLSAKFLVDVLQYSVDEIEKYLPIAGKEEGGTAELFLKNTPLNGKVRVKTGSMSGIQSYAGYVNVNGKKYAFTIIINHWNGKREILQKDIEKLLVDTFK